MGRRDNYRKPTTETGYKSNTDKTTLATPRSTQTCKACMGIGHYITNQDTICYNVVKAQLCSKFIDDAANAQLVKSNTYRYRKDRKEKSLKAKRSSKMSGVIRQLEDQGHTPTEIAPMIHMARALENISDTDYSDSDTSDASDSE